MDEKQNQSEELNENLENKEQTHTKKNLMSLSSFIILILLIVIVIMGIYIYKQNQAEKQAACVIDPLKANNIIQTETKNETIIENTISNEPVDFSNLTDKQAEKYAQETLEKYLDKNLTAFENSNIGPMPNILVVLNLDTTENIETLCMTNYDSTSYIRSNTKYQDFKNTLLEYVSEEYFNENFSQYKNINDNVAFCNCAGGFIPYKLYEINFKSKENNIYKFDIILEDLEMLEHANNSEENISESDYLIKQEATFKLINNKLVIHEF